MGTLNSIILHFYDELAKEAAEISRKSGSHTLRAIDVQTAAKIVLSHEVAAHAIDHGAKAVLRSK